MYFVVRDGRYHDCTHITFRQFMNGALKGEIAAWEPTLGDWTNHLSTLFPDVRLKRFSKCAVGHDPVAPHLCAARLLGRLAL